ncbi:MAG: tetratricopeptide repeat protein [Desulfobacteraceae bacterium]|nr:tetratricopeptide repeat protein [Desulfobacteraceae bacterium]
MKTLIADLLSESGRPELVKEVAGKDARLKTLYTFTGGNPRMAVFLSDVLRTEVPDEMLSFMDNILDELTPYFEAILKDIPDSLEEIINTLAAFEPALSPKEIAQHLEVPQTTVRNYLKQLKENGYVRIAFSKGKSNYYCLNEYLYRVWYQMRDSSHREETRWLMELLLMLYSPSAIIEEKPVFSYKELIVQTADFVNLNPDYCKIIELCVDSTTGNEQRTITETNNRELFKKAFDYRKSDQYEEAIAIYKNILKNNPKSDDAYNAWGTCLRATGRYEEAIVKLKEAIKINPKSETAYWRWGACLHDQKHYEEAIEKFKEAIKINPKHEAAYGAMGDCFRGLGQYDKAEKQFKKAISINPNYDHAYAAWGDCLRRQDRYEETIEKIKQAIKINPKRSIYYEMWCNCLWRLKRYNEAIEKCKETIKIDPKSEYAYWLWGDSLLSQGHYQKAISLFEKHMADSKDEDAIYSYGKSLMGAERYNEALKQFEHIIKIKPGYYRVYLSYGRLLEKMSDSELALLAYLKHISFGYDALSANFNFQKIHNEHIHPLLKTLKPGKYIKQFYASEKERKFSEPQLSMFLILLAKYDTASEHFQDIISAYRGKDDKEKEDFNLLIFTIKLSIWLKLCEGNFQDVLRLTELYIDYIKTLEKTNQKEKSVSNFSLNLFKIQINADIDSENIRTILQRLKEREGVPFSDIFFKIWTCLNEPDSVEAQRFLNEKAIAEVVKELKKKQSSVNFICDLLPG